ncbi:hypothetical protein U3516DRAFT_151977 [Neocallimastix sp. 'constans']
MDQSNINQNNNDNGFLTSDSNSMLTMDTKTSNFLQLYLNSTNYNTQTNNGTESIPSEVIDPQILNLMNNNNYISNTIQSPATHEKSVSINQNSSLIQNNNFSVLSPYTVSSINSSNLWSNYSSMSNQLNNSLNNSLNKSLENQLGDQIKEQINNQLYTVSSSTQSLINNISVNSNNTLFNNTQSSNMIDTYPVNLYMPSLTNSSNILLNNDTNNSKILSNNLNINNTSTNINTNSIDFSLNSNISSSSISTTENNLNNLSNNSLNNTLDFNDENSNSGISNLLIKPLLFQLFNH